MRRPTACVLASAAALGALALPGPAAAARRPLARLTAFNSCAGLVGYARRQAARPGAVGGVPVRALAPAIAPLGAAPGARTPAPTSSAPAEGDGGFSTTNVQEAGVDEPDLVKSDGKRLFTIAGGALLAIDVSTDTPRLLGSLALEGSGHELLVRGERALVIGTAPSAAPVPLPEPLPVGIRARGASILPAPAAEVQLTEVDLRDPAHLRVARTLTVAGSYVTARLTGGTARVVLSTPPRLPIEPPTPGPVPEPPTTGAPATGRTAATRPGLASFLPRTVLRSRISGRTFRRALVPCRAVRHPPEFSGLDLLTVLTVDLDRGLFNVDRDAVMAGAQVVYASQESLYVASQRFVPGLASPTDVPQGMRSEIHRFDTSRSGATAYRSSGEVPGFVLNQFALSEYGGVLRVASTEEPLWLGGAPQRESESAVSVLRERDGRLELVGRVGGLGRGERIYAVRFIGDVGYVVTFRQVDPLYTLDLSHPEAPRVLGELKLAGYSAYLHPIGEDLVLGVGQDATEEGRRRGSQLSVFDVSDLRRPVRLHQRALGPPGSSSPVEFDHRAFLWWAPTHTAVVPVEAYGADAFSGAVALRVRRAQGIEELGRASHGAAGAPAPVRRALVVGSRLVTLSDRGVAANGLTSLAPLGFLAFPAPR